MAVRTILVFGDPRLEAENARVERFDAELDALVADMFETSWAAPGLGLAAPQVAVNMRLAVIDLSVGKDPAQKLVLANPEIVWQEGKVTEEEGCLSFPSLYTTITRPRRLRVRYQDQQGEPRAIEAEGLLAQALCHEIDHLDGRLLVHHLHGMKKRLFLRRVDKMRSTGVWR